MTRVEASLILLIMALVIYEIIQFCVIKRLNAKLVYIEELLEDETQPNFGGVKVVLDKDQWKKIEDEWYYILDWMGIHALDNCYVVCDKDFEVEEIETYKNALGFYCKEKPKKDIEVEICIG